MRLSAPAVGRTDGIPLFVEEMTKAVIEVEGEGEARRTAAAVPPLEGLRSSVPSPAMAVPPRSARTANGAPRSAGADRRGGADRGGDRLRVFACSAGRGGAQTGRGAQFGARSSLQQVCYFARACLRTRVIYSSTRLCRTPRTHWARSHWERGASRHVLRPRLCRPVRARGGRQAHAANSSKVYLRKSNETSAGKRVASDARRGCS